MKRCKLQKSLLLTVAPMALIACEARSFVARGSRSVAQWSVRR